MRWLLLLTSGDEVFLKDEPNRKDLEMGIFQDNWPLECETADWHEKDRQPWLVRCSQIVAWRAVE